MLKNNGKKTAVCLLSTAALSLLLLLLVAVHQRVHRVDEGTRGEGPESGDAAAKTEELDAAAKKGFSAYFSKLSRGRREAEKPAGSPLSSAEPPRVEDISANDIFIAVKTTKKFHQSRLNLLLDTWISRNMQQVDSEL